MESLRTEDDTVKGRLKEFCENTSAHAIGQTVRTGNRIRAIFWTVVFVGALTGCVSNIVYVATSYLSYGFSVKSKVVFQPQLLKFPSVTVCNLNPISSSKQIKSIDDFKQSTGLSDKDCDNEFDRPTSKRPEEVQAFRTTKLPRHWFEYNENVTNMLGHSKQDFIVDCSFESVSGCENQFTVTKDPNLYNCYTFQPPQDYEVTLPGLELGLSFTLFLENTAPQNRKPFFDGLTMNSYSYGDVGVKVVIHKSGTHPFPHSQGVTADVGKTSNFVFRSVHITAIGPPHPSPCNPLKKIDSSRGNGFVYSQELCAGSCFQKALAETCGCVSIEADMADKFGNEVPFCGSYPCNATKVFENYQCYAKVLKSYMFENKPDCGYCTKPCKEQVYETSKFYSKWPSTLHQPDVKKWLENKPNNTLYSEIIRNMSAEAIPSFIENNFLRINVYFTDVNVRMDTETLDTDWFALFSNIGGAFGFWVGISIVTGVEVLELIFDFLVIAVDRRMKKRSSQISQNEVRVKSVVEINSGVYSHGDVES